MTAYVDASVLLRLALRQPDSLAEWNQVGHAVSSQLILTECFRTLDRLRLRTRLSDTEVVIRRSAILSLIASLEIIEIESSILQRAGQPMPTELGTLDAIHLATAIQWKESKRNQLVMATHDIALALGARAHGFEVVGVSRM